MLYHYLVNKDVYKKDTDRWAKHFTSECKVRLRTALDEKI